MNLRIRFMKWLLGPTIEELEAISKLRESFALLHEQSMRICYYQCKAARMINKELSYSDFKKLVEP
jgi:hypothetical protein